MQAKTLKIIAALLIISAVFMGVIGYKISQQEIKRAETQQATTRTETTSSDYTYAQKLLITNRAVSKGEVITAEDLQLIPFPISVEDSYQTISAVAGKPLEVDIPKGAIIRPSHFQDQSALSPIIAPGYRAISIKVSELIASGGFLRPGDYVDVVFSAKSSKETQNNSMARRLLSNIKVLAYGEIIESESGELVDEQGNNTKPSSAKKDTSRRSRSAVLEVALADVNKLILAEERGELRLSAIGDEDLAVVLGALEKGEHPSHEGDDSITFMRAVTGLKPPPRPRSVYVYNGDNVETIRVPK